MGVEPVSLTAAGPAGLGLLGAGVLEELAPGHAYPWVLGVGAEWEGLVGVPVLAEVFLGEPLPLARGAGKVGAGGWPSTLHVLLHLGVDHLVHGSSSGPSLRSLR